MARKATVNNTRAVANLLKKVANGETITTAMSKKLMAEGYLTTEKVKSDKVMASGRGRHSINYVLSGKGKNIVNLSAKWNPLTANDGTEFLSKEGVARHNEELARAERRKEREARKNNDLRKEELYNALVAAGVEISRTYVATMFNEPEKVIKVLETFFAEPEVETEETSATNEEQTETTNEVAATSEKVTEVHQEAA